MTTATPASEIAHETFVVGLRNAHAMEKEALELIKRQLELLENYPQVEERMRRHLEETRMQHERLDKILDSLGEDRSVMKDVAMGFLGNVSALFNATADDAILKNSFANFAFEHFEISAYKSLLTLAEMTGATEAASLLRTSLEEEKAMASWLDEHVPEVTERYIRLKEQGEEASA